MLVVQWLGVNLSYQCAEVLPVSFGGNRQFAYVLKQFEAGVVYPVGIVEVER